MNTLEALDNFKKIANADANDSDDSDDEDTFVPSTIPTGPAAQPFTIYEDANDENSPPFKSFASAATRKPKLTGVPFRPIEAPEVDVNPSGNPYLGDGLPGIGRPSPQRIEKENDFVIYEDPDLDWKSRSPVNEALYQELRVSNENLTDLDIIGKNLNQLLASASASASPSAKSVAKNPKEKQENTWNKHTTNTTISDALLDQIHNEPTFYQSTGSFHDTESFLQTLADLDEDTIENPGSGGLEFVCIFF